MGRKCLTGRGCPSSWAGRRPKETELFLFLAFLFAVGFALFAAFFLFLAALFLLFAAFGLLSAGFLLGFAFGYGFGACAGGVGADFAAGLAGTCGVGTGAFGQRAFLGTFGLLSAFGLLGGSSGLLIVIIAA